jgi:3-oxoacyl-[acyl-carrier protein] reductase
VDTLTQVLAAELGARNIRVNAINPGMVESEGTHAAGFIGSDFQKKTESSSPLGRIGQPRDIASVAVFLAGNDAGWLTGEKIVVSGGF